MTVLQMNFQLLTVETGKGGGQKGEKYNRYLKKQKKIIIIIIITNQCRRNKV